MVDNDPHSTDDAFSDYQRRATAALADLERRAVAARDAVASATNAEAGRLERRVEGWSTWQTVGAAVATFAVGVFVGAFFW